MCEGKGGERFLGVEDLCWFPIGIGVEGDKKMPGSFFALSSQCFCLFFSVLVAEFCVGREFSVSIALLDTLVVFVIVFPLFGPYEEL